MKRLNAFVYIGSFALCVATASMASAAGFSPAGAAFTTSAGATLTVKSPSMFGAAITCNIQLSGVVRGDGSAADILTASVSGSNALCRLPSLTHLPWVLTPPASGSGNGVLANVGYAIPASSLPGTQCGPTAIVASQANGAGGFDVTAANQVLSGNCTVVSLSAHIPNVIIVP
ncbi:alkane oxidation protein activator PraB [Pseudomonas sp. Bout1]|uniref:alkane oxidation protein activator PraB n=1 Tax=Pseudomonas sp. Bout1 TaxID=3048600 RepID=UPI002AB46B3E|nr:alkane oxidation protein activator PraB [Pseudomonas sp. Bout1]MDY7532797.1 alkane oxidation protein activator PraB [Pseudomonas sp. Bout1]MEB0185084.1 alkane oxidation protein activator PraB [Pseudomonas sp. Bout1]